jgi:hypothetical protein
MAPPEKIEGHIGRKDGGDGSIGETGPLVAEGSRKAYFVGASHSTRIVEGGKEHILTEFRVLLGLNIQ